MVNLVLGSEGFVGSYLCSYLKKSGQRVERIDIKRSESQDLRSATLDFSTIDRVFFLAWEVGGAKYLYRNDTQALQMAWNVALMQNVFPQLEKAGKPFVFISSQLAHECESVYSVTKRLGERWTLLTGGSFVRLWNVYGQLEPEGQRAHVISDLVRQAVHNGRIELMTNGEEKRQFIHLEDVCRALVMAIENPSNSIVDVTSFEWVSIKSIARLIANLCGAEVVPGPKAGSSPSTPIFGKIPGWSPSVSLEQGLQKMIDQARQEK